jgi:hypothetical protein
MGLDTHLVGVTTKVFDVLLDPLESETLVLQAKVECSGVGRSLPWGN